MSLLLLFGGGVVPQAPDECLHGHTADSPDITTTTTVDPAECLHVNTTDAASVVSSLIVPADATHSHTVDAATVSIVIVPADCTHTVTTDQATLTAINIITPAECFHVNTTDSLAILGDQIAGAVELALEQPLVRIVLLVPSVRR